MMSESKTNLGVRGLVVINPAGRVAAALGVGEDSRIKALVTEAEWRAEARKRRIVPVLLVDTSLLALVEEIDQGLLVLLSEPPADTVLDFILHVDFAYDIIQHILTDPYDAMAIVDGKERLAFISPVHEKFFGLNPGEAIGKSVRDVIENSRLHHVVRTGVAEVGQIHRMNGRDRIVSRHPIRHDGQIVGAIGRIMFKGPQQVEALARRIQSLEQEIATYKADSREKSSGDKFLDAIIGQSLVIQSVRQQIRKIAPLDIPVLIQGESGTGKELVAQALHMLSQRQDGRLVTVNAAALPEALVESELFGYAPGSFTGADKKGRAGKFELADKGTIFLDEIGDMPLDVQSKLLRVLQDRMVERVGGDHPKRVDFRLCSATNRNLEAFVEQGKFRLDLFYRISPVTIVLPSLAERSEDIPLLVTHFVGELAKQYGRQVPEVDMHVHQYLMERPWPGNVRQLRHLVERAFIFSEPGRLTVADFERDVASFSQPQPTRLPEPTEVPSTGTLKESMDQLEATLVNDALIRFQGNKKKAAEYLGISRSYLYKKLEELA
jgi:transcriptional regulator with PAS, ATPase and Fis domain